MHPIPVNEFETVARCIRDSPELLSSDYVADAYAALGFRVISDPFDLQLGKRVIAALQQKTPFSVVRIGDGEANLLSFEVYPDTPNLDRHNVSALMEIQQDRIVPDEVWLLVLRELMLSSILQADIVGVIGLWRPDKSLTADGLVNLFRADPRGGCGHWRAIDYMLRLARAGALQNKVIASAHLYLGVIRQLGEILRHAERILLITDRTALRARFQKQFPAARVELLTVGNSHNLPACPSGSPGFLVDAEKNMPRNMRGYCCLIGAGPWAELYCNWVKQKGGVAIDLGSGFDLLDGVVTRPIHCALSLDQRNALVLGS